MIDDETRTKHQSGMHIERPAVLRVALEIFQPVIAVIGVLQLSGRFKLQRAFGWKTHAETPGPEQIGAVERIDAAAPIDARADTGLGNKRRGWLGTHAKLDIRFAGNAGITPCAAAVAVADAVLDVELVRVLE